MKRPLLPLSKAFWFQEGPGVRNWQFTDSGIKLLNVANIEKGGVLNLAKTDRYLNASEVEKRYSHFLVDPGDLVIASSGISFDRDGLLRTRGAFVQCEDLPLCLNTSTIRFKPIEGVSDLRFLRHWLDSYEFRSQITKFVTGSAQQNFGPSHLNRVIVALPPLTEQQRIADILDKADALRAKRRAVLARLDTLAQSIFLDIFGDQSSIFNRWCSRKLGDLLGFLTSGSRGWAEHYVSRGDLFIRIQNVCSDELILDDRVFVNPPDTAEAKRTRVQPGDVLLSITADLGRTAVVPDGLGKAFINQHLAILRTDALAPRFLSAFLASPAGQSQILRRNRQGVKAGLNFDDIRSFVVPVPPADRQDQFVRSVAGAEVLRDKARTALGELDGLFASLQHRAFRGELTPDDASKAA